MTSLTTRDDLARALVKAAYLEGDFVLRSGARSRYYFDKYLFESDPAILGAVARQITPLIPAGTDYLAGPELGGVALAAAVSLESGLPFVILRKAAKEYGQSKTIEGPSVAGKRVTIVEDVLTTGGAAIEGAKNAVAAGATVLSIIGVVDREDTAWANIEAAGFTMQAVFTKTELERYL